MMSKRFQPLKTKQQQEEIISEDLFLKNLTNILNFIAYFHDDKPLESFKKKNRKSLCSFKKKIIE